MGFTLLIFILWGVYSFLIKRQMGKEFRISKELMPLILICVISTICLGVNYVAAAIPSLNDGIGIHNFLAYWIIGEDNWSIKLFKDYFNISVYLSLFLIFMYCVLRLIKR